MIINNYYHNINKTPCAIKTQTHIGIEFLKLLKKSQFAESLIDVDFQFFNRTTG